MSIARSIPFSISAIHPMAASAQPFLEEISRLKLRHASLDLEAFHQDRVLTLAQIEAEFQKLLLIHQNVSVVAMLSPAEKTAIEAYKLALMQSTAAYLRTKSKSPHPDSALNPVETAPSWGTGKWILYSTLFSLDLTTTIWGSYIGIIELLFLIPALSQMVTTLICVGLCAAEMLMYYAMMSPFLKYSLGVAEEVKAEDNIEVIAEQQSTLDHISTLMLSNNHLGSDEYVEAMRLAKLFDDNLAASREYGLYLFADEKQMNPQHLGKKALVLIGNTLYLIKDGALLADPAGQVLTQNLALSYPELALLQANCQENALVRENADTLKLLDHIHSQASSRFGLEPSLIPPYQESFLKCGLRWLLSGISLLMKIGSGYAITLFFLGTTLTTAAIIGTPIGWGILSALVLGKVACQLFGEHEALYDLINPSAKRYAEVRTSLNNQDSKQAKFEELLSLKQRDESLDLLQHKESSLETWKSSPHLELPLKPIVNPHRFYQPLRALEQVNIQAVQASHSIQMKH